MKILDLIQQWATEQDWIILPAIAHANGERLLTIRSAYWPGYDDFYFRDEDKFGVAYFRTAEGRCYRHEIRVDPLDPDMIPKLRDALFSIWKIEDMRTLGVKKNG